MARIKTKFDFLLTYTFSTSWNVHSGGSGHYMSLHVMFISPVLPECGRVLPGQVGVFQS